MVVTKQQYTYLNYVGITRSAIYILTSSLDYVGGKITRGYKQHPKPWCSYLLLIVSLYTVDYEIASM